jgi:hypothetical protein
VKKEVALVKTEKWAEKFLGKPEKISIPVQNVQKLIAPDRK